MPLRAQGAHQLLLLLRGDTPEYAHLVGGAREFYIVHLLQVEAGDHPHVLTETCLFG
jgi:hypothetical protein